MVKEQIWELFHFKCNEKRKALRKRALKI